MSTQAFNLSAVVDNSTVVDRIFDLFDFSGAFKTLTNKRGKYVENTPAAVQATLEKAFLLGSKIKVDYGNLATGRTWLTTDDVVGRVNFDADRKAVLLRDDGTQCLIKTDKVVRVIQFDLNYAGELATVLYQAANFSLPEMTIVPVSNHAYFKFEVLCDGYGYERFESLEKAQAWVAFMEGYSSTL